MIRNDNSAYGFISLTLRIILIILHIPPIIIMEPIYILMGFVLVLVMPIITTIYGIVGIVKDKKLLMAIIGLILELVYLGFVLAGYLINYA